MKSFLIWWIPNSIWNRSVKCFSRGCFLYWIFFNVVKYSLQYWCWFLISCLMCAVECKCYAGSRIMLEILIMELLWELIKLKNKVPFRVTFKHEIAHWGTRLLYLLVHPCIDVFGKQKIFSRCVTYLLSVLNFNMHWLIFCGLFACLFSWSDYQDDLSVKLYHFLQLMFEPATGASFCQFFILIV